MRAKEGARGRRGERVGLRWIVAAGMAIALVGLPAASAGASASGSPSTIVAAEYFGTADPLNFWSSDLSGASGAFAQMRQDGFNTVGLVVPWDDFEPQIDPPTFNTVDFTRLNQLVSLAASMHLGVMLRLSYEADVDPGGQLGWGARFQSVYADPSAYSAWLGYIQALEQDLSPYHNVELAYLSWEDFFGPYWTTYALSTIAERTRFASEIGYTAWLQRHYTLAKVSAVYGTTFTSWGQVPTPVHTKPSYRLMFRFMDDQLVHRFFVPAQQRFPGLVLEARADVDDLLRDGKVWGTYEHRSTWQLAGTSLTGMDFAPNMNDPSPSARESASDALAALGATLSMVSGGSGGRRLYVFQFLFADNAPVSATAPHLAPDQVAPFLEQAGGLFEQYTDGYGIWTYRNYTNNYVYNPSFALGTTGWKVRGQVTPSSGSTAASYLSTQGAADLTQAVPVDRFDPTAGPLTVTVEARSAVSGGSVRATLGSVSGAPMATSGTWSTYRMTVPVSSIGAGPLVVSGTGSIELTDVQVYDMTEQGDVRAVDGRPKGALVALRDLNHQVETGGT